MGKIDCKFNVVSTMEEDITGNSVWCSAFELAWREMEQNVLVDDYTFNKSNREIECLYNECKRLAAIDDSDYLVASGDMDKKLIKNLIKKVKRKFKIKSELLENIKLTKEEKMFLIYAVLVLKLKFKQKFDSLKDNPFNGGAKLVKYFGADYDSKSKLFDAVSSLFYDDDDSFALMMETKSDYKIVLIAEQENLTFSEAYKKLNDKSSSNNNYIEVASFAVPEISISETKIFDNLTGENLCTNKGKEYVISQALQNVKFELDEKGARVVSEAVIVLKEGCCFNKNRGKDFTFNKPFYLFITKSINEKPVLALKVNSAD